MNKEDEMLDLMREDYYRLHPEFAPVCDMPFGKYKGIWISERRKDNNKYLIPSGYLRHVLTFETLTPGLRSSITLELETRIEVLDANLDKSKERIRRAKESLGKFR